MMICGMKGTSLIDYPGKIAAVIYTKGCNFRCPFCHNSSLVLGTDSEILSPADVVRDIERRKGFIDGVVITGGEPTLNDDLPGFIREIREKGLAVKLDTNGYRPELLQKLIKSRWRF